MFKFTLLGVLGLGKFLILKKRVRFFFCVFLSMNFLKGRAFFLNVLV